MIVQSECNRAPLSLTDYIEGTCAWINMQTILLLYLIFFGIPLARRIEKFLLSRLDLETKKKLNEKYHKRFRFPELDNISEKTKEDSSTNLEL